ncbi:isocitrate lyase/PEP mutase family protein [Prauserella endophytica]|uniref:Isocitrate lyase/phosphoenolpyruvate mutase family protein n=1 Tax=Prauserella endophytica TaxID=1592324 RepID=A0ABY2S1T8_9PSEU|nr:isocitrate lyase/phosphoenolpyruvate mutase family protein [Prauserella endophytica]PXY25117.1 carboxyvinyl-carboxyphosphonate phosphorylmutase [Prauserella coralliicola]TKG69197.1 isocitrate lyase/phosphoenolpyruvate mutase family protein [Prauserella endophytica]
MTAGRLRELHVPGSPLVLPNVWDADSARLVEEAGFPVVATSSVAVARTLGYRDGEQAPAAEMLAAATRIARAVSVPVTVDAEAGYGLAPSELAERLLATGAVGCNLEDTDHARGQPRDAAEQADRLAAVREAAGEDLVLNARVDVFLGAGEDADEQAVLPDALDRARRYLAAGADCVYPIHVRAPDVLRAFTEGVRPAAVNATYLPGGPDLTGLAGLGVARISLGGGLWKATRTWLHGTLTALADGKLPY